MVVPVLCLARGCSSTCVYVKKKKKIDIPFIVSGGKAANTASTAQGIITGAVSHSAFPHSIVSAFSS